MAISTEIDLTLKSTLSKENTENSLRTIKSTIKHINALLETLTLITKIESTLDLPKKHYTLSKISEDIVSQISDQYSHKNISLHVTLPSHIKVNTHKESFRIVFKNLLENAYKYTPKNGEISIVLTEESLSFQDTGIGIEKQHLEHIWERFWKEDNARNDIHSFGLGLYLVKKLIDQLGREIFIESKKNKGTKFTITF